MGDPLPSGIVTFLFSDIEASTRLLQRMGDSYRELLGRHQRLLESAFATEGGRVVDTAGDGMFVAFADARAALRAAVAGQLALMTHPWPEAAGIRVRMGIHSGEATPTDGTYVALAVHRASRIAAAAHGGQILVSDDTRSLVEGAVLMDLGLHRLKDFDAPQRLFQLVDPRLPRSFPAIRTTSGSGLNLPAARSAFVGRDRELGRLVEAVRHLGLVTMTGPPGVGKTRLAVEVARRVYDAYPDGVWLVDLSPVADINLVVPTAAERLGVREQPRRHLMDVLVDAMSTKRLLIVLDNCEHVVAPAAELAGTLLTRTGSISILATSREPLRVDGEHVVRLAPLAVPAEDEHSPEVLTGVESVQLFCERAGSHGTFSVTPGNAAAVARLTRRLDGIPLALELAASLVVAMEPNQILEHLDHRFELLVDGHRGAPARQQTLHAAVEWGYDLLGHSEQQLFRQLGAFAGTFGAEAVSEVCTLENVTSTTMQRLLQSLVQRSMVEVSPNSHGARRYRLLETLRDFAVAALKAGGEEAAARDRHLDWVVDLAETFDRSCDTPAEQPWMDRLVAEADNLRHALDWGLRVRPTDGLRLAAHLGNYWARRSQLVEGRRWLSEAMEAAPEADVALRAIALRRAGVLALLQDDQGAALSLLYDAARAYRLTGDTASLGHILGFLSVVSYEQGDVRGARHIVKESIELLTRVGDERGATRSRARLGIIAAVQGDFAEARPLLEEAVLAHTAANDSGRAATSLANLGFVRFLEGDIEGARAALEQALAMQRAGDRKLDIAQTLVSMGELELVQSEFNSAVIRFQEAAALARDADAPHVGAEAALGLATAAIRQGATAEAEANLSEAARLGAVRGLSAPVLLERMAELAIAKGDFERGAELLGAAAARRNDMGTALPPVARPLHDDTVELLRARLGSEVFAAAWARGEVQADDTDLAQAPAWLDASRLRSS